MMIVIISNLVMYFKLINKIICSSSCGFYLGCLSLTHRLFNPSLDETDGTVALDLFLVSKPYSIHNEIH